MKIRRLLRKKRLKFRVYAKELPGCPDIIFDRSKKVIFIHGCFWHFHKRCPEGKIPETNQQKWQLKLERNVQRDKEHFQELKKIGWEKLVLWECNIERNFDKVKEKLSKFLGRRIWPEIMGYLLINRERILPLFKTENTSFTSI
jgi:DNA mismatch endonuclease (patch repair protein)